MLTNVKQLLNSVKASAQVKKNTSLFFQPFHSFSNNQIFIKLQEIKSTIANQDYHDSIHKSSWMLDHLLEVSIC